MNSAWEYFIACSTCSILMSVMLVMSRSKTKKHLDFTNQSSGNDTELCQLVFEYSLLFELVNVAGWFVIDCSLANQILRSKCLNPNFSVRA